MKTWEEMRLEEYLDKGKDAPMDKLVEYMRKEYPDSSFVENWDNGIIHHNMKSVIKTMYDVFRYEVLNWCGCGDVYGSDRVVANYLYLTCHNAEKQHELLNERFGCNSVYDNLLLLCLVYTMDAAGFTEHGTSIAYAWIEPKGKVYLWLLNKMDELDLYDYNELCDVQEDSHGDWTKALP